MDKETLSNYGWIVVMVLVLACLLAMATPFGKFIGNAIENTTTALFQTSKAGLGSAGIDAGELVFGKHDGDAENPDASASKITLLQSVISTNPDDPIWERTIITDATLKEGEKIKVEFYEIDANTKQPVSGSQYTTMMGNAFNKELTADQLPYTFSNPNGNAFTVNVKMAIAMKISVIDADGNAVDFDMDNMSYFTKTPKAAVMNIYYNVDSTDAHLTESTSTTPSSKNLIPVGGVYIIDSPFTVLEGDGVSVEFPETPQTGDTYEEGDYIYTYNRGIDGDIGDYGSEWSVEVKNTSKTTYGKILSEIAGKPVTNMYETFRDCTSLTTAPVIPNSVTDMTNTFFNCTSLTKAPVIPNSVTDMESTFEYCYNLTTAPVIPSSVTDMTNTFQSCTSLTEVSAISSGVTSMTGTFQNCTSLTKAPVIPNSVTNMLGTFFNCTSLTGTIEVNSDPTDVSFCLQNTQITGITGSCSQETKDALLATK